MKTFSQIKQMKQLQNTRVVPNIPSALASNEKLQPKTEGLIIVLILLKSYNKLY